MLNTVMLYNILVEPRLDVGKFVSGVVYADGKILVINYGCSKIKRFDGSPPYSRLADITVNNYKSLRGLAFCQETRQLFVADSVAKRVLRVIMEANHLEDPFVTTKYKPWALSVTLQRLLVAYEDEKALHVFSVIDGRELQRVPLTFQALHGIELSPGKFLVSYQTIDKILLGVSVIDERGNCLQNYDGLQPLNRPRHMTLGCNGRILIADYYGDQVVVLDSNLKFIENIPCKEHVCRVFYVQQTRQLLVGMDTSGMEVQSYDKKS